MCDVRITIGCFIHHYPNTLSEHIYSRYFFIEMDKFIRGYAQIMSRSKGREGVKPSVTNLTKFSEASYSVTRGGRVNLCTIPKIFLDSTLLHAEKVW